MDDSKRKNREHNNHKHNKSHEDEAEAIEVVQENIKEGCCSLCSLNPEHNATNCSKDC